MRVPGIDSKAEALLTGKCEPPTWTEAHCLTSSGIYVSIR